MSATAASLAPPRPSVWITNFQPHVAGALRGFADVRLRNGMTLHGCAIFSKDGRMWAALPSKRTIGHDGAAKFEPVVSFAEKATLDRWSAAVIAELRRYANLDAGNPPLLTDDRGLA